MRYLLPLLFLLGACQAPNQQDADGSTQTVAILTSNVIDDGTSPAAECSMEGDADCSMKVDADCDKMDAADCPMAGASECSMEGDADCAKEDCAEGSACCKQSECEEE
jgi:hypothetical protein